MGFFQLEEGSEVEGRIAMRMAASALLLAQSIILALSIIPLRADPVDYKWPTPQTNRIEDKSSYVEKLGNSYFVGVGIYRE
jgi:hypothetical protein